MKRPDNSHRVEMKNSGVSLVRIGFDGRVHKWFKGPLAKERFENERRALNYLEKRNCPFVPRILESDHDELYLITSNCGGRAQKLSKRKARELFDSLEEYGVRHNDRANRNITYDSRRGCFCLIDFEFSRILETGQGLEIGDAENEQSQLLSSNLPTTPVLSHR